MSKSCRFVGSLTRLADTIQRNDTVEIQVNGDYHTVRILDRHHESDPELIILSTEPIWCEVHNYEERIADFENDQNWIGLPD